MGDAGPATAALYAMTPNQGTGCPQCSQASDFCFLCEFSSADDTDAVAQVKLIAHELTAEKKEAYLRDVEETLTIAREHGRKGQRTAGGKRVRVGIQKGDLERMTGGLGCAHCVYPGARPFISESYRLIAKLNGRSATCHISGTPRLVEDLEAWSWFLRFGKRVVPQGVPWS